MAAYGTALLQMYSWLSMMLQRSAVNSNTLLGMPTCMNMSRALIKLSGLPAGLRPRPAGRASRTLLPNAGTTFGGERNYSIRCTGTPVSNAGLSFSSE